MIRINGADGFAFAAYHAAPQGERKGGVVVLQEIFGIDRHVRRDTDRWAALGYEAIAPAIFDRAAPGLEVGHDAEGIAAGRAAVAATPLEQSLSDVAAVRDVLAPRGKVFVVGYCFGGSLAWQVAAELDGFDAAASYYGGTVLANAAKRPRCPTIVHLGRKDASIPCDEVKAAVQAANPGVPVYIYDEAGHGFNNEDPARYDEASAKLARQRTLDLFARA